MSECGIVTMQEEHERPLWHIDWQHTRLAPVGHADEQDVVEGVHAIDLGQQLVDHGVMHARAALHAAPLLADGVYLIKDDHMQLRCFPLGRLLCLSILGTRMFSQWCEIYTGYTIP